MANQLLGASLKPGRSSPVREGPSTAAGAHGSDSQDSSGRGGLVHQKKLVTVSKLKHILFVPSSLRGYGYRFRHFDVWGSEFRGISFTNRVRSAPRCTHTHTSRRNNSWKFLKMLWMFAHPQSTERRESQHVGQKARPVSACSLTPRQKLHHQLAQTGMFPTTVECVNRVG